MAGHFLMKDIALQAGVGIATVDRVLNNRSQVHPQTRRRVEHAIEELRSQEETVGLTGRKFIVDVIVEAPQHFCEAARKAIVAEVPSLLPAVFRVRFTMEEDLTDELLGSCVRRIGQRGSHGVILMAEDTPATQQAIAWLAQRRIPVVTFATDVPVSPRIAYVGMDNRRAGQTAAYLIGRWLPPVSAMVLISLRNSLFRGEEDREVGFRSLLRSRFAYLESIELYEGVGAAGGFEAKIEAVLRNHPEIRAVYSIGGNNRTILKAIDAVGSKIDVFVAHDLDDENKSLLRAQKISVVLHHDLRRDMREACRAIMRYHRALPGDVSLGPSQIQVLVPMNLE
jgi:LacI family transcriptional regulator